MPPQAYQPSSLAHTIIALIFYVIMAGFMVYSLIAMYSLIRFGKSKALAIGVSVFYLMVVISLFGLAVSNLNQIKF